MPKVVYLEGCDRTLLTHCDYGTSLIVFAFATGDCDDGRHSANHCARAWTRPRMQVPKIVVLGYVVDMLNAAGGLRLV